MLHSSNTRPTSFWPKVTTRHANWCTTMVPRHRSTVLLHIMMHQLLTPSETQVMKRSWLNLPNCGFMGPTANSPSASSALVTERLLKIWLLDSNHHPAASQQPTNKSLMVSTAESYVYALTCLLPPSRRKPYTLHHSCAACPASCRSHTQEGRMKHQRKGMKHVYLERSVYGTRPVSPHPWGTI